MNFNFYSDLCPGHNLAVYSFFFSVQNTALEIRRNNLVLIEVLPEAGAMLKSRKMKDKANAMII